MTTQIRPDMGSVSGQLDALDRGLVESDGRVTVLLAEVRRLSKRLDEAEHTLREHRAVLRSKHFTETPATPAPAARERRLTLIRSML